MKNFPHWPPGLPPDLELPQTSLYYNLEVAATSYPERTATAIAFTATSSVMPN